MPLVKSQYDLSSPKVHIIDGSLTNHTGVVIPSKDLIGIEVEVENIRGHGDMMPCWQAKGDGSLRNNGMEFITKPIPACDAPIALHSLMSQTLRQDACFSPRTSVHIHLNFADDDINTALDTVLLYSVFELLFYKFVGRQRIKNIYCVPLTETSVLQQIGKVGFQPNKWDKYTGLNAKPLTQFGTLEFRHMHGTFNVRKICLWIDLITRLKEFCVKLGSKGVRALLGSLDDDFDFKKLLLDIFGDSAQYLKYTSLDDVRKPYQTTKLALCKGAHTHDIAGSFSRSSQFYSLRNL